MTYTLPIPAGKIFYPAEGDNEGDDAFDAEQVRAAYDKGLKDAAGVLTKLITMAPTFNEAFAFSLAQETIRAMKGTL